MTTFAEQVRDERARLALIDPDGELEAAVPLDGVRARQRLLTRASAPRPTGPVRDDRDLLYRLNVDPDRGRGVARCPAHEDRSPSLSWRIAEDGRVLLHCFSGCTWVEIIGALR